MRKLLFAAIGLTVAMSPKLASAAEDQAEASPTGKGITGGALLGAEAVMLTEAALKVKPWWAYAVGGIAGGIAGGVGGYFAEQSDDAKLSMYLLTGGMVLAIPTTVAVLSATDYEPPADYTEDRGPVDEPAADPAAPQPPPAAAPTGQRRSKAKHRRVARGKRLPAPPALVGMGDGALSLSVPAVEIRDLYSKEDRFKYGVAQKTEVRVPVFEYFF